MSIFVELINVYKSLIITWPVGLMRTYVDL